MPCSPVDAARPTPHLTRSSLHRCLQRPVGCADIPPGDRAKPDGIARLPETDGAKPKRSRFKADPTGFVHLDLAGVRTEEGRLHLFVAVDRTSKPAFAKLEEKASLYTAADFLRALIEAVPAGSTPCSPTMARRAATRRRAAQARPPCCAFIASIACAASTASSTA